MKKIYKRLAKDWPVLLFYFLVTFLLTYPWILKFGTHKLGDDIDGSMLVWNLWWFAKSIFDPNETVFFTNYIFYPIGTGLVFHTLTILNGIFGILLTPLAGLLVSFNILTFLTFLLSGYGMFLLVEYLTGNRAAAVIAGFIYAFCPFRMMRVSFINYLTTQWFPFYFLFLIRLLKGDGKKYTNIIFCSIFLLFNGLICEIYGFFAAIYTIPFFLFYALGKNSNNKFSDNLLRVVCVFLIFAILFSPLLFRMLGIVFTEGQSILSSTIENARYESADSLSYFIPSPLHPLWGNSAAKIMSSFTGIFQETVVFPGFVSILLCLCSLFILRGRREVIFFFCLAIFSALMSFGPYLHYLGRDTFFSAGIRIPMPYYFTYFLPFFGAVRIPGRYGIMAMIFISLLAGYGYKYLAQKVKREKILFNVIIVTLLFEFWTAPFPLISNMKIPEAYKQIKNDKGDFSLLHIPMGWRAKGTYHYGYNFTRFQYYQTYHEKRIMDGMLARTRQFNTDYFANLPIVSSLVKLEYDEKLSDEEILRDKSLVADFVNFYNVKYIVVDEVYERVFSHLTPEILQNIDDYLHTLFDLEAVYDRGTRGEKRLKDTFARYSEFLKGKNPPRLDPFYREITSLDTTYKVYRIMGERKNMGNAEITPLSPARRFYLAGFWKETGEGNNKFFSLPSGKKGILLFPSSGEGRVRISLILSRESKDEDTFLDVKINNRFEEKINIRREGDNLIAVIDVPEVTRKKGINRLEIEVGKKELLLNKILISQSR